MRRHTIGYVSQFLRVMPRVATRDIVAGAAREQGASAEAAESEATAMLRRLNVPERLRGLPPATFSGGEQQRVNIARGFVGSTRSCCSTSPPLRSTRPTALALSISLRKRRRPASPFSAYSTTTTCAAASPIGSSP
jgi:predicted ABC-type transport system involved in lysophospholipase L1 biosynthesis ATPase subunit